MDHNAHQTNIDNIPITRPPPSRCFCTSWHLYAVAEFTPCSACIVGWWWILIQDHLEGGLGMGRKATYTIEQLCSNINVNNIKKEERDQNDWQNHTTKHLYPTCLASYGDGGYQRLCWCFLFNHTSFSHLVTKLYSSGVAFLPIPKPLIQDEIESNLGGKEDRTMGSWNNRRGGGDGNPLLTCDNIISTIPLVRGITRLKLISRPWVLISPSTCRTEGWFGECPRPRLELLLLNGVF